jgi:hypothetical protein
MIRKIIEAEEEKYIIHIPKEYLHRKVEILILPMDESNSLEPDTSAKDVLDITSGILFSKNIDPISWQQSIRDEWNHRL